MKPDIYKRPEKPLFIPRKVREDFTPSLDIKPPVLLAVSKETECHVTPQDVAERMASYLECDGLSVLEPSAGTGSLVRAALAYTDKVTAIELNHSLFEILQAPNKINADFLQVEGLPLFDRVIMNPPFSKAKAHIERAKKALKPGGFIIALVPVTFSDERAQELERLPVGTFKSAAVYSKIMRIYSSM